MLGGGIYTIHVGQTPGVTLVKSTSKLFDKPIQVRSGRYQSLWGKIWLEVMHLICAIPGVQCIIIER